MPQFALTVSAFDTVLKCIPGWVEWVCPSHWHGVVIGALPLTRRVAMMMIGCPKRAEAALREMSGRSFWGSVVEVTRVCRCGNPSPQQPGGRAKLNPRPVPQSGRRANTQDPETSQSALSVTAKVGGANHPRHESSIYMTC